MKEKGLITLLLQIEVYCFLDKPSAGTFLIIAKLVHTVEQIRRDIRAERDLFRLRLPSESWPTTLGVFLRHGNHLRNIIP